MNQLPPAQEADFYRRATSGPQRVFYGPGVGRKVCPQCRHMFKNDGSDVEAHWATQHPGVTPYDAPNR